MIAFVKWLDKTFASSVDFWGNINYRKRTTVATFSGTNFSYVTSSAACYSIEGQYETHLYSDSFYLALG